MKKNICEKGMVFTFFWLPIFNVLMYLGLLVSFFCSLKTKKIKGRLDLLDWSVILFSLAVFFSVFFSVDKTLSIYGFIAFLAYPMSYFVFSRNINGDNLPGILNSFVYSSLIICIIGSVQFMITTPFMLAHPDFFKNVLGWEAGPSILHGGRIVSILGNSNVLGAFLVLILPVFACLFLQKPSLKWGALFVLNVFILFITHSKSALIGLFIAILVVVLSIRKKPLFFWSFMIPAIFLLIFDFSVILRTISGNSSQSRMSIWNSSINLIKQHPVNGWGINTFQKISPVARVGDYTEQLSHAHNVFLNLGVETGFIGIIFFCFFLIALSIFSFKLYKKIFLNPEKNFISWMLLGIISATFGFTAQNLVDYFFARGQIGVLFFSFAGIIRAFSDDQ